MTERKVMSIEEFRETGYLQEVNRLFFHPLGLALSVVCENGEWRLCDIWDSRDDPEGFVFSDFTADDVERGEGLREEFEHFRPAREAMFGSMIQPLVEGGLNARSDS